MTEENRIKFEAHLRAIEDAIANAEQEGGCDYANYLRYHCEQLRLVYEGLIGFPVLV